MLTYVRNDYGERAGDVSADEAKRMRAANPNRETPWSVEELRKQSGGLEEHWAK